MQRQAEFTTLREAVAAFSPGFPATSAWRTLFMLLVVRPLPNLSVAGLVLHVIQNSYRAPDWAPVA